MQIKTPEELEVMQFANDIASAAHVEVKPQSLIHKLTRELGPLQQCTSYNAMQWRNAAS